MVYCFKIKRKKYRLEKLLLFWFVVDHMKSVFQPGLLSSTKTDPQMNQFIFKNVLITLILNSRTRMALKIVTTHSPENKCPRITVEDTVF